MRQYIKFDIIQIDKDAVEIIVLATTRCGQIDFQNWFLLK